MLSHDSDSDSGLLSHDSNSDLRTAQSRLRLRLTNQTQTQNPNAPTYLDSSLTTDGASRWIDTRLTDDFNHVTDRLYRTRTDLQKILQKKVSNFVWPLVKFGVETQNSGGNEFRRTKHRMPKVWSVQVLPSISQKNRIYPTICARRREKYYWCSPAGWPIDDMHRSIIDVLLQADLLMTCIARCRRALVHCSSLSSWRPRFSLGLFLTRLPHRICIGPKPFGKSERDGQCWKSHVLNTINHGWNRMSISCWEVGSSLNSARPEKSRRPGGARCCCIRVYCDTLQKPSVILSPRNRE
jgi:hypothetical protein